MTSRSSYLPTELEELCELSSVGSNGLSAAKSDSNNHHLSTQEQISDSMHQERDVGVATIFQGEISSRSEILADLDNRIKAREIRLAFIESEILDAEQTLFDLRRKSIDNILISFGLESRIEKLYQKLQRARLRWWKFHSAGWNRRLRSPRSTNSIK